MSQEFRIELLEDMSKFSNTPGEWKLLSEKFANLELKKFAKQKFGKRNEIVIFEGKISDLDQFRLERNKDGMFVEPETCTVEEKVAEQNQKPKKRWGFFKF